MAFESLTDDKIADLLNCSKRLVKPNSRRKEKEGHEQYNFKVLRWIIVVMNLNYIKDKI